MATGRACYKFEANVNDTLGSYNLTSGGVCSYQSGKLNQGFRTSGATGTYGYAQALSDLGMTNYNYTYSFWYKHIGVEYVTGSYLFCHMNKTLGVALSLQVVSANTMYATAEGSVSGGTLGPLAITPSSTDFWHYCITNDGAATAGSSTFSLYVNGYKYSTYVVNTGGYGSLAAGMTISAYRTDNPIRRYVRGVFDEFRVENRAWTPGEVRTYYTESMGRFNPTIRNY
jgi:hypothetical protein